MGRIKTIAIRSLAGQVLREHGKKFTEDFEHNKKILNGIKEIKSKRIRNVVVGYITAEVKKLKKSGI